MAIIGGYADINRNLRFWMERILEAQERPRVIYDVGANEGQLTVPFLDRIDFLVAFEPNPNAVRRLTERLSGSDRSRILPIALSERSGSAELIQYSDDSFNSFFRRPASDLERYGLTETATETVVTDRLDDVVEREGLPDPSLIKIDVEGAELAVLRGSRETLFRAAPAIIIEYSCINTRNAGYDRRAILSELRRCDYEIGGLYRAEDTRLYQKNALESCRIWNLVCLPVRMRSVISGHAERCADLPETSRGER